MLARDYSLDERIYKKKKNKNSTLSFLLCQEEQKNSPMANYFQTIIIYVYVIN